MKAEEFDKKLDRLVTKLQILFEAERSEMHQYLSMSKADLAKASLISDEYDKKKADHIRQLVEEYAQSQAEQSGVSEELNRSRTLLDATLQILRKSDGTPYATNALYLTANYDEAECDGYCLMADIKNHLSDLIKLSPAPVTVDKDSAEDWNNFMNDWNNYHRNEYLEYIRDATKEKRKEMNQFLQDMRSSMKWCHLHECKGVMKRMQEITEPPKDK